MHCKSELYASDSKFRIITYYPATQSICRSYGKTRSGETMNNMLKKFGIAELCTFLRVNCSRDLWKYELTKEEAQNIVNNFRKNTEKSNFEYIGFVEINR